MRRVPGRQRRLDCAPDARGLGPLLRSVRHGTLLLSAFVERTIAPPPPPAKLCGAPGDWTRVVRRFRDGDEEVWWAAEATLGPWGPDGRHRLVVATTDPATLPALSTWYLLTNLPRPGSPRTAASPLAPADLAEVVR